MPYGVLGLKICYFETTYCVFLLFDNFSYSFQVLSVGAEAENVKAGSKVCYLVTVKKVK